MKTVFMLIAAFVLVVSISAQAMACPGHSGDKSEKTEAAESE